VPRWLPWRACHKPTFSRRRRLHAPPFDPVRRRARTPAGIERLVHQNRLLKITREGGQMTPADLAKFEPQRRYATLVALAIEGMATVTDEIIDLHDRILGKLFNTAKNKLIWLNESGQSD